MLQGKNPVTIVRAVTSVWGQSRCPDKWSQFNLSPTFSSASLAISAATTTELKNLQCDNQRRGLQFRQLFQPLGMTVITFMVTMMQHIIALLIVSRGIPQECLGNGQNRTLSCSCLKCWINYIHTKQNKNRERRDDPFDYVRTLTTDSKLQNLLRQNPPPLMAWPIFTYY